MNNPPDTMHPRALQAGNKAKRFLTIVGYAILAPLTLLAVGGLWGVALFAVSVALIQKLRRPVFNWIANKELQLVKAEARRNPVETLEVEYRTRSAEIDRRQSRLKELATNNANLKGKVDEILERFKDPNDPDYVRLFNIHAKLVVAYNRKLASLRDARESLVEFGRVIERSQLIWEAGIAALEAGESSGYTEDDFMRELQTKTAIDAVNKKFHSAISAIDVENDLEAPGVSSSAPARVASTSAPVLEARPPRERQKIE